MGQVHQHSPRRWPRLLDSAPPSMATGATTINSCPLDCFRIVEQDWPLAITEARDHLTLVARRSFTLVCNKEQRAAFPPQGYLARLFPK